MFVVVAIIVGVFVLADVSVRARVWLLGLVSVCVCSYVCVRVCVWVWLGLRLGLNLYV